jgi:stage IV sporulation protein FB
VIAIALFLALGGIVPAAGLDVANPGVTMLGRLLWANVFLVLFNLIPAFPMDGGRVLRAFLAHRMGYARGTQVAATIGQALAFGFGLLGLLVGNPLLLFIALFVYLAASAESHAAQMRQVARGVIATDVMITKFESLSMSSSVEDAVQCLIRTTQHEFPILDEDGRLQGVLTRDEMIKALKDQGPTTAVTEVMRADIPTVHQRRNLDEPLRLMQEKRLPAIGIVDAGDRLVGLLTPENIGEMMMVEAAIPEPAITPPWRRQHGGSENSRA